MNRSPEKELDQMLRSPKPPDDPEAEALWRTARAVEETMGVEAPSARRERAVFVSAVATRSARPFRLTALAVPFAAGILIVAVTFAAGRVATPGESLYPIKRALSAVGLAPDPADEVSRQIERAREKVALASSALGLGQRARASDLAAGGIVALERARALLGELEAGELATASAQIMDLRNQAAAILGRTLGDGDDEPGGNSGPGSDDSGGNDDSSGPGSGDDSSGPGSGDDSSGSGSGGDSSGSGSGDDSSGSGS